MVTKVPPPSARSNAGHDTEALCFVQQPASMSGGARQALDCAEILRAAETAAYEWRIDTDRLVWSDNAASVFGLRDTKSLSCGRGYARLLDRTNAMTRYDAVFHSGEADQGSGVPYQTQYALRLRPRGRQLWIEDIGRWFAGENGKPARAQGLVRIINERHEREQQLTYRSRFDPLTGEINRWHLIDQLERELAEAAKTQGNCGFLLIAIDHLGRVNEAYGYEVADEVIGCIARRLRGRMRSQDCLGRFSGNKFGIILRDCAPEEIGTAAERFLRCVREDVVMTSAGSVCMTATAGGVIAPRHAANVQEVMLRAQETLDRAQEKRPGSFLIYLPDAALDASRKANILATDQIVNALNERRIEIAFEPVAHAQSREIAFHECLLRIRGPDGTLIPAADIIPRAERLGLVRLLDQRVLELVIAEMVADPRMRASLNVSASSILDSDWWLRLEALLRVHDNVAERLIVEITETAAIHDIDNACEFARQVKDLGARIAIDDFGAGFTSFRNLRKLGVDMIKIDGAFVEKLASSEDDRTFVRTMIELARGLKLKVVAEWVQDEAAATLLASWGCDFVQGEFIGRAALQRSSPSGGEPAGTPPLQSAFHL